MIRLGRPLRAGYALDRMVAGFIRRGDLAAATLAALETGEERSRLIPPIAAAFARTSPRLSAELSRLPPPLPSPLAVDPTLASLSGDALLDRATTALRSFVVQPDDVAEDAKIAAAPFFSALDVAPLEALLSALRSRECATGDVVVRQGEPGGEAYVVVDGALEVLREDRGSQPVRLASLGPGRLFGEMALVSAAPRAATVRALEPTQLLVISRETLARVHAEYPEVGEELGRFCQARMVENLLRHSELLAVVPLAQRTALLERFTVTTFAPGDALVAAGQPARGLFLIASGEVEVFGADEQGEQVRLARLGPGDFFGESALALDRRANATVVATHETVTLSLGRDQVAETLQAYPAVTRQLADAASRRDEATQTVLGRPTLEIDESVLV